MPQDRADSALDSDPRRVNKIEDTVKKLLTVMRPFYGKVSITFRAGNAVCVEKIETFQD